jgi:two-component system, OmpR family, alkaline phosphatase synthesis response regulator PhoP
VPNKNIFIIEDDDVVRTLLEHILQREGYVTVTASTGKDAMEQAAKMGPPSLVLSDIMMPYMDGYQVAIALKALEGWSQVPIVMLTSKGQEQDIVRALDNGADDYMVKPFHPGELLARLRRFLR